MLSFVSLDVLGEYAKSLFAHSLCTHKFFQHILFIRQNSLGVYGEGFDEIGKKAKKTSHATVPLKAKSECRSCAVILCPGSQVTLNGQLLLVLTD
jgi:hypothetical protein